MKIANINLKRLYMNYVKGVLTGIVLEDMEQFQHSPEDFVEGLLKGKEDLEIVAFVVGVASQRGITLYTFEELKSHYQDYAKGWAEDF